MRLMRRMWLKGQGAHRRTATWHAERKSRASQWALLHSARVESIKARRFQQRVEELRRSHAMRHGKSTQAAVITGPPHRLQASEVLPLTRGRIL